VKLLTPWSKRIVVTLTLAVISLPAIGTAVAGDFLTAVREQVAQLCGVEHDSVQVTVKPRAADWPPTGRLVAVDPLSGKRRGTLVVDAVREDGSHERLTLKVRTWDRLWCAAHAIEREETIYPGLVETRLVETTRLRRDILRANESPLGLVTRRRLAEHDLLARTALAAPQAVKAGNDVRVLLRCGQVVISDTGHALQSGCISESILVRSRTTGRVLQGSIGADGQVHCFVD